MKRFFLAILSLSLLLCSFVSCKRTPAPIESVAFDTLTIDTICPLFLNYSRPACRVCINLAVPAESSSADAKETIERFICSLPKEGAFEIVSGGRVNEMVRYYIKDYLMSYLSEGPNAIDNYGGDTLAASNWMSYEESLTGIVLYNENDFLSYQLRTESYTGGAHGNSNCQNAVLCLTNSEPMRLSNLFSDATIPVVNDMIRQKLAIQNDCVSVDELTEKGLFFSPSEIEATDNFYLDEHGITWIYDPYDIAPYSMGEITVTISWNEALELLDSDSEVLPLARLFAQSIH